MILIYVDDLGWSDVGFNGSRLYLTPNIDRLAESGMVFTNAYSNGPNCAPSRASLMTGLDTPRHGIFTVGNPNRGDKQFRKLLAAPNQTELAPRFTTLGELATTAGYETAFLGKWHLGDPGSGGPGEQGFAINIGGNHTGHPAGGYFAPYQNPQLADPQDAPDANDERQGREYLTDRLTQEAVSLIRAPRKRPLFLCLAHYAVHTPIQAPPATVAEVRQSATQRGLAPNDLNLEYAAMLDHVDRSVGAILQALDETNLRDTTLVIFTSDNGGVGRITDNAPLRGAKGMLYEGGIRVPFAVSWPGVVTPGTRNTTPIMGSDLFATFHALINGNSKTSHGTDGQSLLPLWKGAETFDAARSLYWHFPAYLEGKNADGAADAQFRTRPAAAIRRGPWKLIEYFEDGRVELYHLDDDIGESRNIRDQHPQTAADLQADLHAWQTSLAAPIPDQPNPDFVSDRP